MPMKTYVIDYGEPVEGKGVEIARSGDSVGVLWANCEDFQWYENITDTSFLKQLGYTPGILREIANEMEDAK